MPAANSGLYVAPIRSDVTSNVNSVFYNTTTGEMTYAAVPAPIVQVDYLQAGYLVDSAVANAAAPFNYAFTTIITQGSGTGILNYNTTCLLYTSDAADE